MSQYKEMHLARLKYELRKRDGRVTGRKWELFQQATPAELVVSVCHTSDAGGLELFPRLIIIFFLHVSPFTFIFN